MTSREGPRCIRFPNFDVHPPLTDDASRCRSAADCPRDRSAWTSGPRSSPAACSPWAIWWVDGSDSSSPSPAASPPTTPPSCCRGLTPWPRPPPAPTGRAGARRARPSRRTAPTPRVPPATPSPHEFSPRLHLPGRHVYRPSQGCPRGTCLPRTAAGTPCRALSARRATMATATFSSSGSRVEFRRGPDVEQLRDVAGRRRQRIPAGGFGCRRWPRPHRVPAAHPTRRGRAADVAARSCPARRW